MTEWRRRIIRCLACLGIAFLCVTDQSLVRGLSVFAQESSACINWAFDNDGTFSYEDHDGSWYGDTVTVQSEKGIDIEITDLWKESECAGKQTIVALVDTGVYVEHPDLSDCLWVNSGEVAGDGIDNDENGYIDDVGGWNFYDENNELFSDYSNVEDAHGTHCAGLIGAKGTGVVGVSGGNSDIVVMPLKVLGGTDAKGSVSDVIEAIQYAETNGAVICNLSVGFKNYNEELYQTMKNSRMLFVVAAGNGESDTNGIGWDLTEGKRYPACYDLDNMIVTANLKCDGMLHYSSCYGVDYVDLAVPGTQLYSTSSRTGYSYMTGTSMAAPILSGTAALLYNSHPEWGISDVKNAIINSTRTLSSLSGKVKTGGMLDAAAASAYRENIIPTAAPTEAPVETPSVQEPNPTAVPNGNPTDDKKVTVVEKMPDNGSMLSKQPPGKKKSSVIHFKKVRWKKLKKNKKKLSFYMKSDRRASGYVLKITKWKKGKKVITKKYLRTNTRKWKKVVLCFEGRRVNRISVLASIRYKNAKWFRIK